VKKFLFDNGVAPSKIVSATGSGSKKPIVDEPEPASEAAKAMNPEELEALRNKNRRLTLQAVNVCPVAERAEVVQP
jgi:outer membrane protein OmpA-like peptidoglycan-associated protein